MATILRDRSFDIAKAKWTEQAIAAEKALASAEFPTRHTEDWRYAKLGGLLKQNYSTPTTENVDISSFLIEGLEVELVVLVNGFLNKELSSHNANNGVTILPIEAAAKSFDGFDKYFHTLGKDNKEIFTALNTVYNQGGVFVHVDKNTTNEKPIYILNIATDGDQIMNSRNLVIAEQSAEVKIIQGYFSIGDGKHLNNSYSEFFVGKNAKVTVDKIQKTNTAAKHICTEEAYQENDSTFKINTFMIEGGFIRNGINIKVDGTNCHSEMNGLVLGHGNQFIDNHTRVDHLKSNCISSELYKCILKDKSTGVFNGKVIVHQDAQIIEAYQQNNNIIMSDTATMNTKPELEIYADDVKCSHGATTGQFDEKAIFYLQARGVSRDAAKEMLIGAFAGEVLEKVDNDVLRDFIEGLMG
jgi:Fe-S cluster assembly protein SufD